MLLDPHHIHNHNLGCWGKCLRLLYFHGQVCSHHFVCGHKQCLLLHQLQFLAESPSLMESDPPPLFYLQCWRCIRIFATSKIWVLRTIHILTHKKRKKKSNTHISLEGEHWRTHDLPQNETYSRVLRARILFMQSHYWSSCQNLRR